MAAPLPAFTSHHPSGNSLTSPPSNHTSQQPSFSSTLHHPSPTHSLPLSKPNTTSSPAGLRTPSNRRTIYDRNLNRSRNAELSRASFAYLFMEMVSYAHKRISSIQDLEKRLNEQGYMLGGKCLDMLLYRQTPGGSSLSGGGSGSGGVTGSSASAATAALPLRPLRLLGLLTLLTTKLYPLLFARPADSLEQSTTEKSEYMIIDNTPLTNTFISVPKEMNQLSVAAFIAGVLEGVCDAAGFQAKVSAHNQPTDVWPGRTVFLLRFDEGVVGREAEVERLGVK